MLFGINGVGETSLRANRDVVRLKEQRGRHLGRDGRWILLRDCAPLATRAEHIHDAVDDFAQVDRPLAPASFAGWYARSDELPLGVRQVARVAQLAAVIAGAVLVAYGISPCRCSSMIMTQFPNSNHRSCMVGVVVRQARSKQR